MLDIAIIGAGIGGLTAALRLHQLGYRPKIYEGVPVMKELGVGIAIQPYGVRELTELGLLHAFRAISVDAEESVYFNQYGQTIYGEKCGIHMGYEHEQRFVHRGAFQMMLYEAVQARLGPDAVVLGARCTGFEQDDTGVTIRFKEAPGVPAEVRADVMIGADGIKSAIRAQLYPERSNPHYSGITLWRGVSYQKPYRGGGCILHVGAPSIGSLIVYPILDNATPDGLTLTNWVVEQNGLPASVEDWNQRVPVDEIAHMFDDADPEEVGLDVGAMLRASHEAYIFPLIDHDPLPQWSFGRVTLMGDAAHAMYPRGGNGACSALVDARVIAELLHRTDDPVAALKEYEAQRLSMVNRIVLANRGDGPEVVRRIVEERTGGARFNDIETVLPFAEADAIFAEYHRLAGMKRPQGDAASDGRFKPVFATGA